MVCSGLLLPSVFTDGRCVCVLLGRYSVNDENGLVFSYDPRWTISCVSGGIPDANGTFIVPCICCPGPTYFCVSVTLRATTEGIRKSIRSITSFFMVFLGCDFF